jgi:hypothetical protein
MSKPLLHLDADTSIKALQAALLSRGHDVTRTPNEWMALDASDELSVIPNMVASFWLLKTVGHYLV